RASSLPIVPQPISPTFLDNLLYLRFNLYYNIKLPSIFSLDLKLVVAKFTRSNSANLIKDVSMKFFVLK
ncbi:MAG TPA: hypothetical protein VHF08_02035, partial [Nitrososphaeraceae archaeon]|nr:hypothetical protein [Nitrososphaeraceae archaeon]